MSKINNFREAFVIKLQALYDIEKQLEKALPKMEKVATNADLKEGFENHLKETQMHARRLETIFEELEEEPKRLKVEGIRGIIEDGEWVTKTDTPPEVMDMMLAGAARHAEHYEMSAYLGAIAQAEALEMATAVDLLSETFDEERAADEKLSMFMQESLAEVAEV